MRLTHPSTWFSGKAASRTSGTVRLPQPRSGGGACDVVSVGGQLVKILTVGGKPSAIRPSDVGDPLANSIVAISLNWIGTSWPLAVPQIGVLNGSKYEPDKRPHPLLKVLQRPNPHYSGKWLWWALNADYWCRGNAYAQLIKGRGGLAEINYLPSRCVKPIPDSTGYLDYYEYTVDGQKYEVDPEFMLHFRFGINPDNILEGLTPLYSAFREIVKDNSVSDYEAGVFKNGGMPPALLTPRITKDSVGEPVLTEDEARVLTEQLQEKMQLSPGQLRFISSAMQLLQLGFKPKDMATGEVRKSPETRIPALFQIPPVVLGLEAGLERSTFNNVGEAVKQAWNACLIPTQDYFAEEFTVKALPFYPGSEDKCMFWDRSNVGELQPDKAALREQARKDKESGIITVEEARSEGGRQTTPEDLAQLEAERPQPPALPDPNAEQDPANPPKPAKLPGKKSFRTKKASTPEAVLENAAEAFRDALAAPEEGAVAQMGHALETVEIGLQEKLRALVARMEQAQLSGEPISDSWLFQERRYQELIAQCEESMKQLGHEEGPKLAAFKRAAMETATTHAELLTRAALGEIPEGVTLSWNRLPVSTLEHFVGFSSDGTALGDLLGELGPELAKSAREALLQGIAEGKSPQAIARKLEDAFAGNRNRALTTARTEVNRAHRTAAIHNYAANPDITPGWTWLATLNTRTCAGCWAMHGTEHAHSETLDDHPNGRCIACPQVRSLAEITGDPSLPDNRPKIAVGTDQFAKLSAADQEEILGSGAFALFRDGKIELRHMVTQTHDERWGTMRRPATLAEAQAHAAA
jgi:HK97 family phage portal protein